jgi:hypothetical protein
MVRCRASVSVIVFREPCSKVTCACGIRRQQIHVLQLSGEVSLECT